MKMHKMLFSYDRAILQLKLKKVKTLIWELPCMLGWLLLVACNAQPANERQAGTQPDIFPDYIGVTVPVDIAPLNFAMADDSVSRIDVTVKGSLGGSIHVGGDYADFPIDEWHELLNQNRGAHLSVSVAACREGRWTRYRTFLINVGNDSIGARSITYRRIAPGYEQYGHMGIYKRSLASFDETALVDNSSRPGMCVNCHTNNGGNGEQYVFHARNENGGTFIKHNGKLARVVIDKKSPAAPRSFVYPGWHPSGRYCAFSTNKTSQMFHLANAPKRIEVYDSESDVFVYDVHSRHTHHASLLGRDLSGLLCRRPMALLCYCPSPALSC